MIYLGIDYHKQRSVATAVNEEGKVIQRHKIDHLNMKEDLLKIKNTYKDTEIKCVMESTMNWGIMYDNVWEIIGPCVLANPHKMKVIAESSFKSDKVDSYILATFLRMNFIPKAYAPSPQIRVVKDIIRHRLFLVKEITKVKNRLSLLLLKEGYFEDKIKDDIKDRTWSIFSEHGKKILMEKLPLWSKEHQWMWKDSVELLKDLESRKAMIEKHFYDTWEDNDPVIKRLMSIPGIGLISAITLRYEVDDINRFQNSRKFVRYCGLCPTTHSSDLKIFNGKTVKSCNKYLKTMFIECTLGGMRGSVELKEFYNKLKITRKPNIAKVALAKKICELVYHIWKGGHEFDKKYL